MLHLACEIIYKFPIWDRALDNNAKIDCYILLKIALNLKT